MTDPPVARFFIEVGIIEHLARTASERVLPAGLSSAGFAVLNHLTFRGPTQGPAQIAAAMQVTKGAMTGTLKRLEAQGLVRIAPDPSDGRGKAVSLTDAGAAARGAGFAALAPMFGALLQHIGAAEIEAVLPTLQGIRAYLDAARD